MARSTIKTSPSPTKDAFASATIVDHTKKPKRDDRPQVQIGESLDRIAALRLVKDAVEALYEAEADEVKKGPVMETFVDQVVVSGRHQNFRGTSDLATAGFELRKRSAASALTESEVERLDELGIPTEKSADVFFFNPTVLEDPKLRKLISDFLTKTPEFKDVEVVKRKPTIAFVGDETFAAIEKLKGGDPEVVREALAIVGTVAIKEPALADADLKAALGYVTKVVGATDKSRVDEALKTLAAKKRKSWKE